MHSQLETLINGMVLQTTQELTGDNTDLEENLRRDMKMKY
jgi:hypothetical protein